MLATVHSSTCAEALQRVVSAFPSEIQGAVRAQLADCLVAVVCQRLRFRADMKMLVPECEILMPNMAVKSFIRNGDFFKIVQVMETGAEQGMWTWQRYQNWIENKKAWHFPDPGEEAEADPSEAGGGAAALPALSVRTSAAPASKPSTARTVARAEHSGGPIEIEPVEGGLDEVLRKFEDK